MKRTELEHILRAAATIANVEEWIVVRSQSVLGQFPAAPSELLISREADLFPRIHPEHSDLIDSTIGEGSAFDRTFGYYAHGVDESTSTLPKVGASGSSWSVTKIPAPRADGVWRFTISPLPSTSPGVRKISISTRPSPGTAWCGATCWSNGSR